MKTSTKVAIGYSIVTAVIIFSAMWYASQHVPCNESGLYEFTVVTHEGVILKDTIEMGDLPKESLCRAVHYPVGLKPILANPIESVGIDNWHDILQKCSTEQKEYQMRTKVEYYFAKPRLLKR